VYPFLPAISRGLNISVDSAGLLVSARNLAGIATPAVVLVGRRRRLLIGAAVALFGAGALITAATGLVGGAIAGFILMGLGKPAFDVGAQSYLADRTPYSQRARVISIIETTWAGGFLLGAPAAGWLIDRFGWEAPFWVIGLLAVGALTSIAIALEGGEVGDGGRANRLTLDASSAAFLAVFVLFTFAAELLFVVLGNWLETDYDLSILALGGVGAMVGLSELAGEGATFAFTDRLGKKAAVSLGMMVAIAGYGVITVSGSQVVALVGTVVAFLGFEYTIVSGLPFATEVRPLARARYLGLIQAAMALARAGAAAIGNPLFDAGGIWVNGLAAAGVNLVALGLLWRLVQEPD
jgi:predicted MFS family arabinose efflux permease